MPLPVFMPMRRGTPVKQWNSRASHRRHELVSMVSGCVVSVRVDPAATPEVPGTRAAPPRAL